MKKMSYTKGPGYGDTPHKGRGNRDVKPTLGSTTNKKAAKGKMSYGDGGMDYNSGDMMDYDMGY